MSKIFVQTYMVRSMSRGVHGPKPITSGPTGSVLVLGPDQKNKNLGPDQDLEFLEISDQLGPGLN